MDIVTMPPRDLAIETGLPLMANSRTKKEATLTSVAVTELVDGDVFSLDRGRTWHVCMDSTLKTISVYCTDRRDDDALVTRIEQDIPQHCLILRPGKMLADAHAEDKPPTEHTVRLKRGTRHVTVTVFGHENARATVGAVLAAEIATAAQVVWVKHRPTCDHCDQPATRYITDGQETPLCKACGIDHYDTAAGVEENTGKLGVSRFVVLENAQWN